ncbi:g2895 [Coccomyxa elongata]
MTNGLFFRELNARRFARMDVKFIAGYVLMMLLIPEALGDAIDWEAMLQPQGGGVRYDGDGTYYGQQGGQNDGGACSFGKTFSNSLGLSWKAGVQTYIALNRAQYNNSQACGQCLMYRGLGPGIGMLPIPSDWQYGLVDNVCPECAYGSIDLDKNGDGRWKIEWYPIPCNVGDGKFHYYFGGSPNPYWFMFAISNTRVPIQNVKLKNPDGAYYDLARGWNNMWAANGGPFTFPIDIQITSVLGDTVHDAIQSTAGGDGQAQFPDHPIAGNAQAPAPLKALSTEGGRRMLQS